MYFSSSLVIWLIACSDVTPCSIAVKIPQVLKILMNKSAEGISIWGVLMELFAVTAATAYCFVQEFPFRYCYNSHDTPVCYIQEFPFRYCYNSHDTPLCYIQEFPFRYC